MRAVIFDMDGLMLDTEPLAARAWDEAAAALGVSFDGTLARSMIGRNWNDCCSLARAHYAADYPIDDVLARWHDAYEAIVEREGIEIKRGLTELLDWLEAHDIVKAVATSTRRSRALRKLERVGVLDRFASLVGGDEVPRGKPAPDIFLAAAQRLGAPPEACVVLEDSEPGVEAALAGGMTPIMVPDLHAPSPALSARDVLVLSSLHDVREHLATRWPAL